MTTTPEQLGLIVPPELPIGSDAYEVIAKYAKLITTGTYISIDPSIGSTASLPGYAVYSGSVLIDYGVLNVVRSGTRHRRLFSIGYCLRTDFPPVDILVIEQVPYARHFGKGYSSAEHQASLNMAIGAIMCSISSKVCIEITPKTWQVFRDKFKYSKSDANDAVAIGWSALKLAQHALKLKEIKNGQT